MGEPSGGESGDHSHSTAHRVGPLTTVALCWAGGIVAARSCPWTLAWLFAAAAVVVPMLIVARRRRAGAAWRWALVAIVPVSAAWSTVRQHHVHSDHVARYIEPTPAIVEVTGVVDGQASIGPAQRGAFAPFFWAPRSTLFVMRVESIVAGRAEKRSAGRLLVKIGEADHRLREGDRIAATGWLTPVRGPENPGELDYRLIMARRGIDGRLTLVNRDNWRLVERRSGASWPALRGRFSNRAAASLRLGMDTRSVAGRQRLALLDAILLGKRDGELRDLTQSFRRVGLAHLLSISGAHLAILLGLTWWTARITTRHPRRAALFVLAVLALYMLVVPWRVPIVRAAVMAGLFALGYLSGRVVRSIELMSLAALIILIWRPSDLFSPGFQLSFGCVAGLLLFTVGLSRRIYPPPVIDVPAHRVRSWLLRRASLYAAANVVAYLVALPLVAHHFGLVTPLTVVLSLACLPVVTVALGLGYVKLFAGLLLPSLGIVLARPLEWSADLMAGLVSSASNWPGATIELSRPPSVAWTIAALAVTAALLGGFFARRRAAFTIALSLCVFWLAALGAPDGRWLPWRRPDPALRMNMLSVGDGACIVARFDRAGGGAHVLMFDCGSLAYLEMGIKTVVPALKTLDVDRIDTLILSHADLDHYCGVLDVIDRVPVGRVLAPPQLLAEARDRDDEETRATRFLVDGLIERGVPIETISRGWSATLGPVSLHALWPPADLAAGRANDASVVLSVRLRSPTGPVRRILLNADIQEDAIEALLDNGADLRADVCDLPHHGSFVKPSPPWLEAVGPSVVLQSCGRSRLRGDAWADLIGARGLRRYVTARDGMIELSIDGNGDMTWSTFKNGRERRGPEAPSGTTMRVEPVSDHR